MRENLIKNVNYLKSDDLAKLKYLFYIWINISIYDGL